MSDDATKRARVALAMWRHTGGQLSESDLEGDVAAAISAAIADERGAVARFLEGSAEVMPTILDAFLASVPSAVRELAMSLARALADNFRHAAKMVRHGVPR